MHTQAKGEEQVEISELLKTTESVWFDRKKVFHQNRVELLHDILCLTNAYHEGDRFLLLGQADDGSVTGISKDPNRLSNAQLHDLLRQSRFNRIPSLTLVVEQVQDVEVAVIHIQNRPDKPFFVTQDKSHQGRTIRAGVIYTRLGDTNTPMGEAAPEEMVELMWRERLGLGLSPLERFHRLLDEPAGWVEIPGTNYRYHRQFPEFTVQDGADINTQFSEPWTKRFPDPNASSYHKEVRYLNTLLERLPFVACDGGRYQIPLPTRREDGSFFLAKDSVGFKLANQLPQYLPLEKALIGVGVELA